MNEALKYFSMKPLFFASRLTGLASTPALVSTAGKLVYTSSLFLRSFAFLALLLALVLPLSVLVFFITPQYEDEVKVSS